MSLIISINIIDLNEYFVYMTGLQR